MEGIGKRESARRRLLELWGNVSAALARDGSVLLTDPSDVHLLDGTIAFLAPPSSPSRERVEVLEEENKRLRDLIYRLSDALTDEGADWSNDGVANLRDRCARALPDAEWLQPYLKAPSDG